MILPNYPEVIFDRGMKDQTDTQLINYQKKVLSKELFDNLFSEIIWVSYRRGFTPMYK